MNAVLARVHEAVDDVGVILTEGLVSRPILGERLGDDRVHAILRRLNRVPEEGRREAVWHLILQGFDRRILRAARGKGRRRYRNWTGAHAPEVERPEDAGIYSYAMGPIPPEIARVTDPVDRIGMCVQRRYRGLGSPRGGVASPPGGHVGGQDEVIVGGLYGFSMQMDGQVWRIRWSDGRIEPYCRPPRMPSGAAVLGTKIIVCVCRWSERERPTAELGGIYAFDSLGDPKPGTLVPAEPVALRVPWRDGYEWGRGEDDSDPTAVTVYTEAEIRNNELSLDEVQRLDVSRPICYPNDLAIDSEGRYLYFTEPSPYTSMGLESKIEAVKLTRNGRLWRVDLAEGRIGLAAERLAFVDGVLPLDDGVLVTELSRFRMLKLDFTRGEVSATVADLPGMPDGATRFDGKIWQSLLHERTWPINLLHKWAWLKWLYVRLPSFLKPPPGCGILVLDDKTLKPLYCTMHDGSRMTHLATVTPSERGIFLPSFHESSRGLHWIDDPLHRT